MKLDDPAPAAPGNPVVRLVTGLVVITGNAGEYRTGRIADTQVFQTLSIESAQRPTVRDSLA